MSLMLVAKALHLIGAVFWIGGTVVAGVALANAKPDGDVRPMAQAVRRAMLMIATPGMLLAFAGGLINLLPDFGTLYAKAGWMHGKLGLVVIAAALSGVLSGKLRRIANGGGRERLGVAIPAILATIGILIVVLAVLRPF